ncbi:MAG: hypothetical protein ACNYPE_00770, partial [Candidatus Azotimanducaceae bacterium WSBS_2022_MAG_OTU7]
LLSKPVIKAYYQSRIVYITCIVWIERCRVCLVFCFFYWLSLMPWGGALVKHGYTPREKIVDAMLMKALIFR